MRILLDTQVLILSYLGESLPKKVQAVLADPLTERFISSASVIEIAIKSATGKLSVSEKELRRAARDLALTILPLTSQHAYRMFQLPWHHRDPFDRMIIATALTEGLPLASGDHAFHRYAGLKLIW